MYVYIHIHTHMAKFHRWFRFLQFLSNCLFLFLDLIQNITLRFVVIS
jgi:hypothetical protein